MASERILLVGSIVRGEIDWRLAPLAPVTDADLDALIDEVYGKPGLGVEDSAGLFDDEPWPLQANERMGARYDDRYDGCIEDDHDWIRGGC